MKTKFIYTLLLSLVIATSCKDQLDVRNPNQPTASSIDTENNIITFALGAYYSGWRGNKYGGFFGNFLADVMSYHSVMGDEIGVEAANVYINQLGMPDEVRLDNGNVLKNPSNPPTQLGLLRFANQNSFAGQNPVYYEWSFMYALNNHCNGILENVDKITYTGDAETKKNTLKAWAYWWKGFAYSRIGSMYVAGIINNEVGKINSDYVSRQQIIAEANANFDKAIAALNAITSTGDYNTVLRAIIPSINQVGKGQSPSTAMWIRNINTMKARNILVNNRASAMTTAQWNEVLALTNSGILATDNVFTGRSNATADFMSATSGTVALIAAGDPATTTFKVSERLIQDFRPGDNRFTNNFTTASGGRWIGNSDRGTTFNTRYALRNNSTGVGPAGASVIVYANQTAGSGEVFLAGTYEENELMKAEANIYLGNLAAAATSINAVRTSQGSNLAAVVLADQAAGREEVRRERRVALAFRGLAFYDSRRLGYLDPVASGGGRSGCVVLDKNNVLNTNAQINYNFLDYWDVPDNEIAYNPPSAGSVPVTNPRTN